MSEYSQYGLSKVKSRLGKHVFLFVFFSFAVWGYFSPHNCFATQDPLTQLKQSVEFIEEILQREDSEEKWVWKKEEIVRIIKERFDSEELAQRVLARHWKKRTDQEKKYFVDLFSDVLENTYINRLKAYSGEQVIFKKQSINENKSVVYSVVEYNKQEIPVNYRLKKNDDEWLVYDIIIEGVSLVSNYRKQFGEVISRENYSGLIRRMEEKIREIKEKDSVVEEL